MRTLTRCTLDGGMYVRWYFVCETAKIVRFSPAHDDDDDDNDDDEEEAGLLIASAVNEEDSRDHATQV